MTTLPIIFGHLGFSSTDVFVVKDGRQLCVGTIFVNRQREGDAYSFDSYDFCLEHYVKRHNYLTIEELPTGTQAIAEYKKQLAEKGVSINGDILYAG